MGGGTGMVGDPSGRTDMRQLLTREMVKKNVQSFKKQFSKFIDFSEGQAIILIMEIGVGFKLCRLLRDVGRHFSVNRMLSFECFKSRLEKAYLF